jgi:superfamily II DNA/RNA helicase
MLFSATMPGPIVALARTYMRHPMNIRAESSYENATVPATAQYVYQAHDLDKPEMIGRILVGSQDVDKVVVFARTKRQAQRVADDLVDRGFNAGALHGDMAQVAREKTMQRFRDGKVQILVCTDVAARGIDVTGVSHVINYTTPDDEKTYVHRIGRTGRAGASGIAVTLVDWADIHKWKMINKALDLPFDEPAETYSSSENFLHDMGIPKGTKGRVKAAAPVERKPREKSEGERSERAPRNRNRTRTRSRSGEPVEGGTPEATADAGPAAATGSGSGSEGDAKPASRNRRRRRRSSGSRPSESSSAAASSEG